MKKKKNSCLLYMALLVGVPLLVTRGCNSLLNNRLMEKQGFQTISYATGLTGHVEYSRFSDGSQDVKIYPGLGHRLFDSELYQDIDGDGRVDRIRRHGAGWKMNRLSEMLIREHDYDTNKKRFDKADGFLQKLMQENK